MAFSLLSRLVFLTLFSLFFLVFSQPFLDSTEQESVYRVLDSINSDISWRELFPDDLCYTGPHGVVCDYFTESNASESVHVTELSFGYVSDYSPNPPCTRNSTLDPVSLSSLPHLKKLFFYKCFTDTPVRVPDLSGFRSGLEELIFLENPGLFGSFFGNVSKLRGLRRLLITGSNISGELPNGLGDLVNLEQITLSRNSFLGEISGINWGNLKKLKVLDLGFNGFNGFIPKSIGVLSDLIKLDLSSNGFKGKIPESLKGLRKLEFMDLSYNGFVNNGVPLFLGEMVGLKEVYLNGNLLGGVIPEIWENLEGILGIGLSGNGLVGNIPASMGVFLRNVCYLRLDNNMLVGGVPEEFGGLELMRELNIENNRLSGKVPFSVGFVSKIGEKLRVKGNLGLCVEQGVKGANISGSLGELKLCDKPDIPTSVPFESGASSVVLVSHLVMVICLFLLQ